MPYNGGFKVVMGGAVFLGNATVDCKTRCGWK